MTISVRMFTLDGRTDAACTFHRNTASGGCTAPATLELELFDADGCEARGCEPDSHAECKFGQGLDCLNADACTNPHHDRRIRRLACEQHANALLDMLSDRSMAVVA
jgi:hypothetical protein